MNYLCVFLLRRSSGDAVLYREPIIRTRSRPNRARLRQ
jgi:hypothetical protein